MAHFRFSILIFSILPLLALKSNAAIFGPDDRVSITSSSPVYPLARATAIAVLTGNETFVNSLLKIDTEPLSDFICKDQKFSSDPSLSYACTGFLVAPDLLVTAGHCMSNHGEVRNEAHGYCEVYHWLFDYQTSLTGETDVENIPSKRLYRCKQIIYAVNDEEPPYRDFALIQLDRPVTDRVPLKIATTEVKTGDSTFMIGYPLGTPMKLSAGANVIFNRPEKNSYVTNLSALDGNSGSPVFNKQGEITGILVSGTPSAVLVKDAKAGCSRYNRCDKSGNNCAEPDKDHSQIANFQTTGSVVEKIDPVLKLLNH